MKRRPLKAGKRPSVQPRPTRLVLGDTFRWLKLDDSARSFAAMGAFASAARVAGRSVADHARAERLRGSILYVRCETSAWSHQLQMMKEPLLRHMQKTLGSSEVKELRCNVGPLSEVPEWERPVPLVVAEEPPPHQPPPLVAEALAAVDDDELRLRLERLYGKLGSRGVARK